MTQSSLPAFNTKEQAIEWMVDILEQEGESCIDNKRFAFVDDPTQVAEYATRSAEGCCGSVDHEVIVAGRPAMVGCNFGH